MRHLAANCMEYVMIVKRDWDWWFRYGVLGRRMTESYTNGLVYHRKFWYDGQMVIYEESDGVTYRYYNGNLIDEVLCREDNFGSQIWYLTDALGSVYILTDNDGNVVEAYHYTIYGSPKVYAPDGTPRDLTNYDNRILFTSREYIWQLHLYYYRFRWYVGALGVFCQKDPFAYVSDDFTRAYRYSLSNPMNLTDPLGLIEAEDVDLLEVFIRSRLLKGLAVNLKGDISQACINARGAIAGAVAAEMYGALVGAAATSITGLLLQAPTISMRIVKHAIIAAIKALFSKETFFVSFAKAIIDRILWDGIMWVFGKAFPELINLLREIRGGPQLARKIGQPPVTGLRENIQKKLSEWFKGQQISVARWYPWWFARWFFLTTDEAMVRGLTLLNKSTGHAFVTLTVPVCYDEDNPEKTRWFVIFSQRLKVHTSGSLAGTPVNRGTYQVCVTEKKGNGLTYCTKVFGILEVKKR